MGGERGRGRSATIALLLITAATGTFDAVGFLALDGVFTGNMTGNVLFIAFALLGAPQVPLVNNVLALAGFFAGAAIAGRLLRRRGAPRGLGRRSFGLLGAGLVLLVAACAVLVATGADHDRFALVTTAVGAAMGMQVVAVKPAGNTEITTIVITNTIANLAADSALGGGAHTAWADRAGAVVSMFAGAAVGALALRWIGLEYAMVPGILLYAAGAAVLLRRRRDSGAG